jgi:hypothetical protein
VRSATHRRGRTSKACASRLRTISSRILKLAAQAASLPEYPASAQASRTRVQQRDRFHSSGLAAGDNGFWVRVSAGEVAEVHLERRGRPRGYCIVGWRHGHVAEPGDLDRRQAARYRAEVLAAGRAVQARSHS